MLRTLLIARHGETDWNRDRRWQGHTDVPLNDAGRLQAQALAEKLATHPIRRVVASDLSRARETAQIVAHRLGAPFAGSDPRLRERCFGVFEGLTQDEVAVRFPEAWADYTNDRKLTPPGAESHVSIVTRMKAAMLAVAQQAESDADVALVVSHGGVIRTLVAETMGVLLPPLANGALYRLTLRVGSERFETVAPVV
jgi:probable phosphoglycerate mutase